MDLKPLKAYIKPVRLKPTGIKPSGSLSLPLQGLLFDIYGTLFISSAGDIGLNATTANNDQQIIKLLQKFAIDLSPTVLQHKLHHQITIDHKVKKRQGIDFPEVIIEKIWSTILPDHKTMQIRAFAAEYEFLTNSVYPMPYLSRMLRACRVRNIPMGIISNAQFYTPYLFPLFEEGHLHQAGFDPDLVLLSYQHGHAKPSAYLFDLIAERLGQRNIAPEHVLYVGNDMRNDIKPAQRAGLKTALFAGDRRSLRRRRDDPTCAQVVPDLVITDLSQIMAFL